MVLQFGYGKWRAISTRLNQTSNKYHNRNEIQVKNRLRCLVKRMKDFNLSMEPAFMESSIAAYTSILADPGQN